MNSEMLNEVLTNISKDLEIEVNKTEISEEELTKLYEQKRKSG